MTQLITPLLTKIDASDRANQELSQGVIKTITEEANIYKTAFEELAAELMKRDEYIVKFREKFFLPAPQLIPSQDVNPSPLSTARDIQTSELHTEPSEASLLTRATSISQADEVNASLVQKIIQSCVEQRDIYKNAFEGLSIEIEKRDQEIQKLNEQVKALPSKKPIESSEKKKENLTPDEQLTAVGKDVKNLKVGRIKKDHQDAAIQNYIFLLFNAAKKESIDLSQFNSLSDLSEEDQALLKGIAQQAVKSMNPSPLAKEYDLNKLFRTKKRVLDSKIEKKKPIKNDGEAAALVGKAHTLFAHFYATLKRDKKNGVKTDYSDFIFSRIPFLAGDLSLALKTYEECEAYYCTKKRGPTDPQLMLVQNSIKNIKKIQELFLELLNKCKFE